MAEEINQGALESLDCFEPELRPFITYLLQDLWEIGSSSKTVLEMLKRNNLHTQQLKILDVGCGKGAISIPIAKEVYATIYGIDAIPEFIETAKQKAQEFGVGKFCTFVNGDASKLIDNLKGFNLVMMASVGQILGNVSQTLNKLEGCLSNNGYVILDDCFLPDDAVSDYTRCLRESEFNRQIQESNYSVIDKIIHSSDYTVEADEYIYSRIEARVRELSIRHPEKRKMFESYLAMQKKENYSLENELQCIMILLQKK